MKFTVKRSKWLRGGRDGWNKSAPSKMLNEDGQMCCLGHCASQLGVDGSILSNESTPGAVVKDFNGKDYALFNTMSIFVDDLGQDNFANNELSKNMMDINDKAIITDEYREALLTGAMAQAGHELTFED